MLEGLRLACRRVQAIAGLALAIALAVGTANAQKAISFVQVNSTTPIKQSSVTASYVAAQAAGDLNVVVVGWSDSTAKISSIADSAGNAYSLAVGPTVQSGTATQAIYYAKNIAAAAANSNSVTVKFSTAASYPDLRIAEYAGLDPSNPVDVAVAGSGTSTSSSSGSVTTTNANDLLVGANLVQTVTSAAGTGYTNRVITNPDGDILEDRMVTATGSYSATASVSPSGKWIMQLVAFRAAASGAGMTPNITSVSPSSGPVGTPVTIAGTNFGSTQGTSTVTFNGAVATPTSWSTTSIVAPVPSGANTGNVVVTVSGLASNGVSFTVTTTNPSITGLNPTSGPVGTPVTITGTNFGAPQGASTVTFNGTVTTPTSWSTTSIVAPVPSGANTGYIAVTVGGVASNAVAFTVTTTSPGVTSLIPSSGPVGTSVTITGTNFGPTQGTSTVTFNGTVTTPTNWSATRIVAQVPSGATTGNVVVTVGGLASNGVNFAVTATTPNITGVNPTSGPVGTSVTISGTNFGATQGASTVTFNGTTATPTNWSATNIVAPVPSGANTGNVVVTVSGLASNGVNFTVAASAAISFVQVSSAVPATPQTSATATYTKTQAAGDLNVVVVGWSDSTAKISSIADSAGNAYSLAVGPTVQSGTATQAIYYAKNIAAAAANSNSVTVKFSTAASYPDLRIAEYAGLDPSNPVDVAVAGSGTSTSSSSGSVTTTNANDLLVGANLVQTVTSAAGTGYTNRVITNPDGDILEDRMVTATGSYSATASVSPSGKWIMQLVAFRAAASGAGMTPNITSVSPSSGPVGTPVTIAGTNFGSTQGTSTVTFNGAVATPTSWSATSIVAQVPIGATTGYIVVTVGGVASNGVGFTVTATSPSITSLSPSSEPVGTPVTIAGTNFGSTQGSSTVTFNGTVATPTSWSATSIVAQVPIGATTGYIVVTVGGVASNGVAFTVTPTSPNITSLNPSSAPVGTSVTIAGTNFGSTQGTSTVAFNGTTASPTNWSATSIAAPVPSGATTGNVVVTVGGVASNGVSFTVTATSPNITSLNPSSAPVGTSVTIAGTNFGSTQGTSTVTFNGTVTTPTNWSATRIVAQVPIEATTGYIVVTVGGVASNGVNFTVTATNPNITSLNPSSAPVGTSVAIVGTNFGATQGASTITFNGAAATPTSWSATSIVAPVPIGATTGNVVVTVGGVASNGVNFAVTATPNITGVNPTSGPVGTSVTISGTNFGSTQGTSTVTFNGTVATPTNWSATSIVVPVPSGATTGNVVVTVGGLASNGVNFAVTATNPSITSLNPSSAPVGTSVAIVGTNFGATQGASTITFSGAAATPTSWSATSIVAPVPSGATTGNVVVTVGGVASNEVAFTVTTTNPNITSLNPSSAPVGTSVAIVGTNFGATQGASTITFNGAAATPTSWSATSIVAEVPNEATTGNVVVTVGGQASNGASFTVTAISSGEPTLIQHVSSSSTRGISMASPFCYYFQLPNPTISGNAIVVGFTFNSNPTPTVTDDQGNNYAIVENYYDSADIQSVAIAAAFNVSPGARNISVCFSSDPGGWVQPMATEFNNVVAVDGSGTGSQGTGTSATAGTLTPAVSGDLAYQVVFGPLSQSSFTPGSQGNITWNLLSADLMDGWAGQYGVYNSTSAINPAMSVGKSQKWLSVAILLQAGTSGGVPSGMRIVHLVHENIPVHEASGGNGSFPNPLPLQLPSSGNLLVAMIGGGPNFETVTSLTDTNNNSWNQAGSTFVTPDSVMVQTYFAGNAISSGNLGLTLNWSGSDGDYTILFYDVTGAATSPLDTSYGATDVQTSTSGTLTVPYTLTPAQPGELIFTDTMWDANTGTGLTSTTGTPYFDTNIFSGESLSGPEPVDENNGWGHVISTSTSPISFTWSQLSTTLPVGNWASMAVAFLPADPPGN